MQIHFATFSHSTLSLWKISTFQDVLFHFEPVKWFICQYDYSVWHAVVSQNFEGGVMVWYAHSIIMNCLGYDTYIHLPYLGFYHRKRVYLSRNQAPLKTKLLTSVLLFSNPLSGRTGLGLIWVWPKLRCQISFLFQQNTGSIKVLWSFG